MRRAPQSGGISGGLALLRNIVAALVLGPLAIVIIAFAVANRQVITISFDPFSAARPAAAMTLPLFALIIALLIVGVVIGGIATWFGQGRWRNAARRLQRESRDLRAELDALKRPSGAAAYAPSRAEAPPQRLRLRAPAR